MSNLLNVVLKHGLNALKLRKQTLQGLCRISKAPTAPTKHFCTPSPAFDVSTNVSKDIILFKYENPRFYNILNVFAVCQFVFWSYLSHFAFTTLKDAPVVENPEYELKWYQRINLGENKYRNGIAVCCFAIGYGILFAAWMFTLRSVRFLILRKGGQDVSFVTYGPFNRNRIMTVPLKCISAQESRELARVQLPIKVKNKTLYYVLDMRGEFRNPQLFDYTAGLKRRV
ncbi:transmembrane protein 223 [Scaptodrosophila lebanonensis]|uniref:Transmembrane protein 223 n=1 Tax=Drosophila lebanonensis TaxID=7225 RepID=A0A6J2TPL5_DROLE|nr:transmembrane protein 223 [Scaptodrosophila lebanonensis]